MLDQTPQQTQMYLSDEQTLSGKKVLKGTWRQKQEQLQQYQAEIKARQHKAAEWIVSRIKGKK